MATQTAADDVLITYGNVGTQTSVDDLLINYGTNVQTASATVGITYTSGTVTAAFADLVISYSQVAFTFQQWDGNVFTPAQVLVWDGTTNQPISA